jgi:hypothetical protein
LHLLRSFNPPLAQFHLVKSRTPADVLVAMMVAKELKQRAVSR